MKLWQITTENKFFVKMLWHLLGEYVKATILLVYSICTVHRFFYYLFLFFLSHRFVLFFLQYFLHCSYIVFHCSSTVPFWLATFFFFFFFSLLFVLFFSFYIYHCTSSVFALYIYSAILLSHFFFSFNLPFVLLKNIYL